MNINEAYQWMKDHPATMTTVTLGAYHVGSAFIGSLEMPNDKSSALYKFFFAFANRLAANYSRANASKQIEKGL